MEKKRILVVDDERDLCDILLFNLRAAGFDANSANSAEEALAMELANYDLLLLDVMMDGISGFKLAKYLKTNKHTSSIPIIFLTAKDTEEDILMGFEVGADDYVKKPFSVKEVIARVEVVLSRPRPNATQDKSIFRFDTLVVDAEKKAVSVDGINVMLTKMEFDLLRFMLEHQGQVFSRQQLIGLVWPEKVVVSDRTVDVNITRIRKKIGRYSRHIVARPGFGYLFDPSI